MHNSVFYTNFILYKLYIPLYSVQLCEENNRNTHVLYLNMLYTVGIKLVSMYIGMIFTVYTKYKLILYIAPIQPAVTNGSCTQQSIQSLEQVRQFRFKQMKTHVFSSLLHFS